MTEIRIYIEGGGTGNDTKSQLRRGFDNLLRPVIDISRDRKIRLRNVTCGSRREAFDDFRSALKSNPESMNILLVDSEGPVPEILDAGDPDYWPYLKARDNWDKPANATAKHCYLMVQCMETWIVSDKDALRGYFGQGFNENALPKHQNLEMVAKDHVLDSLRRATTGTKSKGVYDKSAHGFDLVRMLSPSTLRSALPNYDWLITNIETLIRAA